MLIQPDPNAIDPPAKQDLKLLYFPAPIKRINLEKINFDITTETQSKSWS